MADEEKKETSEKRINEKERFRYIGFEVFPGNPKDLFKSDAEKEKLVDAVISKRDKGEIIRDGCTLMVDRVSLVDRLCPWERRSTHPRWPCLERSVGRRVPATRLGCCACLCEGRLANCLDCRWPAGLALHH